MCADPPLSLQGPAVHWLPRHHGDLLWGCSCPWRWREAAVSTTTAHHPVLAKWQGGDCGRGQGGFHLSVFCEGAGPGAVCRSFTREAWKTSVWLTQPAPEDAQRGCRRTAHCARGTESKQELVSDRDPPTTGPEKAGLTSELGNHRGMPVAGEKTVLQTSGLCRAARWPR